MKKLVQNLYISLCLISIPLLCVYSTAFADALLELPELSWTITRVLPGVFVLCLALFLGMIFYQRKSEISLTKRICWLLVPLVISLVTYLSINPPYVEDYNRQGRVLDFEKNQVLQDFLKAKPQYNGVLTVVSPNCPHCRDLVQKLSIVKDRIPERNIAALVFTTKNEKVLEFQEKCDVYNLDFFTIHNENDGLSLAENSFPSIMYLRNGEIKQFWGNDEFGYPAIDWVEQGM